MVLRNAALLLALTLPVAALAQEHDRSPHTHDSSPRTHDSSPRPTGQPTR
ncbi:hypothetical protein [Terriglobus roseus]|nr:hypothetical protein [Terriglobus roseus]